LGSEISYKNLLLLSYLVLFASFFIKSAEVRGQTAFPSSGGADTTRRSILKLEDNSGIPWEMNILFMRR
jgi:hypothetical protein